MNPVVRAVFFVMLMRAAEHFVDYLSARLRSGGGFAYELAILTPRRASSSVPLDDPRRCEEPAKADDELPPVTIAVDRYPSQVILSSPAHPDEILEVCGLLFEIDTIIHTEGRPDRLLLVPISVDMMPLGRPTPSRLAMAWARFSGYIEGLIGRAG